jgi:hypothetical protein
LLESLALPSHRLHQTLALLSQLAAPPSAQLAVP